MNFRRSNKNDINKIMEMIEEAKEYFKSNNIDQWQDGYPNYQVILDDINKGYSFVFIENDNIVASVAVSVLEAVLLSELELVDDDDCVVLAELDC